MVTPLPLSTSRVIPWAQVHARPFLTISPNGIANGKSAIPNGGADYGPDTLLNGTGPGLTVTGGLNEFNLALPQTNVALFNPNSFGGQLLQGNVEYTAQVVLSAPHLFLAGAGMDDSAIKNNGYTNATGAAILYSNATYPPAPGFTLRDLCFDYNTSAFLYGLQLGVPGGTSPDETSAECFIMHVANRGDTGVTGYGLVLDSIEDTLVMHCLMGGSPVSQILNNGGARFLGGNFGVINIPSKFFTIQESVLTNIIIGNDVAPSSIVLVGSQFNGNVGVGAITTVATSVHCKLLALASTINNDEVTAGTGFISGAVAKKVTLTADGCIFTVGGGSTYLPQPIWPAAAAGHVAGYGNVTGCTTQSETPAQLLGIGNQVSGSLLDASGHVYFVRNGYVLPVGLSAAPFGAFVPFNGTSTPAIGPNVSSGAAAPTASTAYEVFLDDAIISSTGGVAVSITITDGNGHTILTGATTLTDFYMASGWTIDFGAFTTAPTVVVVFL